MFLGEDLLAFLTLAFGAALAAGTAFALVKPPPNRTEGSLERPPLTRSIIQILVGSAASIWAIATLLS